MPEICTADSMHLSLLVFTQLFFEVTRYQPAKLAQKQNLTPDSPSWSFKVIYFGVTGKVADCSMIIDQLLKRFDVRVVLLDNKMKKWH